MNIETANRLYELRKKNGYSQEELAAKLGLSRQAVSKWERAEASPDTDNLVELAKLYGISLDELLDLDKSASYVKDNKEEQINKEEKNEKIKYEEDDDDDDDDDDDEEDELNININSGDAKVKFKGGIHIEDGDDVVHIGKKGIHVTSEDGESVHIGLDGIKVTTNDGKTYNKNDFVCNSNHYHSLKNTIESIFVPLTVFGSIIAYLLLGFILGGTGWASYWVLFLLIPLVPSLIDAIFRKQFCSFAYPVLVVGVYCFLGLRFPGVSYNLFGKTFNGFWHPWWFLFLTIPVYYVIFGPIDEAIRNHRKNKVNIHINNDDVIEGEVK